MQSYVGMTDQEISKTWAAKFPDLKPHEAEKIDRYWRRMGKLVMKNRRTEPRRRRAR